MEKTKVALMGFGRIGRNVFRLLVGHPFLEVGVIADVADPVGLAYLLKYDSIYGRFPGQVSYVDRALLTQEQRTPIINARHPGDADWKKLAYRWWCRPPDATAHGRMPPSHNRRRPGSHPGLHPPGPG